MKKKSKGQSNVVELKNEQQQSAAAGAVPQQKLWVSSKLRDSLRPSVIRSEEPNDELFGENGGSRNRLQTHPYIRLADTLLRSEGFEIGEEGDEALPEAPAHRRRA